MSQPGAWWPLQGKELQGETEGILAIKQAWLSTIRTVRGDHKRFEETYFAAFPVSKSLFMLGHKYAHH